MTTAPRRVIVYVAGLGVPMHVGVIEAFLRQNPSVEVVDFVIGDRVFYDWALARVPGDPRLRFHYQHERFDPFTAELPDEATLTGLEARYGLPHLGRYVKAQRIIADLAWPRQLAYAAAYLTYFERLVSELRPDTAIVPAPDSLPFMAANTVFRRNGCHTVTLAPGRLPGRFFVVDNEQEQIPGLPEAYASLRGQPLAVDDQARAEELRARYTQRRQRPSYYGMRYRLRAFPSPIRAVRGWRRRHQDNRYFDFPFGYYARRALTVRLRQPIQRWRLVRLARPTLPERYVYMPLNFEPEAAIDVQSGFYRDQLAVVRRVIAALPAGYALVVKEHPNMTLGARPLRFYRTLARLGAWIVPLSVDSYDILQRTGAVVTIGGTTGVEAFCSGIPVVLIGHAFYEVFSEGVEHVQHPAELAPALRRAVDIGRVDPRHIDRFVTAVWRRSYAGAYELPAEGALTTANYETMAQGIAAELTASGAGRA